MRQADIMPAPTEAENPKEVARLDMCGGKEQMISGRSLASSEELRAFFHP